VIYFVVIYSAMAEGVVLSSYAETLLDDAKSRYLEKISMIGGIDPFCPGTFGEQTDDVPPVDACDLLSYLVLRTSFITTEQFSARKGLEAYNQFVCGWVKEVVVRKVDTKFVTTGRVRIIIQ